jgi:hypothetical protein
LVSEEKKTKTKKKCRGCRMNRMYKKILLHLLECEVLQFCL